MLSSILAVMVKTGAAPAFLAVAISAALLISLWLATVFLIAGAIGFVAGYELELF